MAKYKDNHNERRPQWKNTSMKHNLNGRQPLRKKTLMEENFNGRWSQWKMTAMEDNLIGLASKFCTELSPSLFGVIMENMCGKEINIVFVAP